MSGKALIAISKAKERSMPSCLIFDADIFLLADFGGNMFDFCVSYRCLISSSAECRLRHGTTPCCPVPLICRRRHASRDLPYATPRRRLPRRLRPRQFFVMPPLIVATAAACRRCRCAV
jgi:hypothetical protein